MSVLNQYKSIENGIEKERDKGHKLLQYKSIERERGREEIIKKKVVEDIGLEH